MSRVVGCMSVRGRAAFWAAAAGAVVALAHAEPVAVDLLASVRAAQPGAPFEVAVRVTMEPGWHIYWSNPGDSGAAPRFTWDGPRGFSCEPVRWPVPTLIAESGMAAFGYTGTVVFLSRATAPEGLSAGEPLRLRLTVRWLACREACVPGEAGSEIAVPLAARPEPDPALAALFAEAERRLPQPAAGWTFSASREAGGLALHVTPPGALDPTRLATGRFFPFADDVIRHAAPQPWTRLGNGWRLALERSEFAAGGPTRLDGVLVFDGPGTRSGVIVQADAAPRSAEEP